MYALNILGLPMSANHQDARAAYRKLARKMHPDIAGDSAAAVGAFRKVLEAYKALSKEAELDHETTQKILRAFAEMRRERERLRVKWRAKLRARWKFFVRSKETHCLAVAAAAFAMSKVPLLW